MKVHYDEGLASRIGPEPCVVAREGRVEAVDMARLADRWLPRPLIRQPWPSQRFDVKHPRQEPYAGILHLRICAGGAG